MDILSIQNKDELKSALKSLPVANPNIDLFYKLCPHLSESQVKRLHDSAEDFTLFAVPSPWNTNKVLILLHCAEVNKEEEEDDDEKDVEDYCEEEEDDDNCYDPPRVCIIDRIETAKAESYHSDAFKLDTLFVREAIDWQMANK